MFLRIALSNLHGEVWMADSCYLCSAGAANAVEQPGASSTVGFGTCIRCNVHACPRHGQLLNSKFMCIDCSTGNAARVVLNPDLHDSEEAITAYIADEYGFAGLAAQAPDVASAALAVMDESATDELSIRMQRNLHGDAEFGSPVSLVRQRLTESVHEMSPSDLLTSLGLSELPLSSDGWANRRLPLKSRLEADPGLLNAVVEARIWIIVNELTDGRMDALRIGPRATSRNRVDYLVGLLAAAMSAHRGGDLSDPVERLPGGLYMNPYIIMLSIVIRS